MFTHIFTPLHEQPAQGKRVWHYAHRPLLCRDTTIWRKPLSHTIHDISRRPGVWPITTSSTISCNCWQVHKCPIKQVVWKRCCATMALQHITTHSNTWHENRKLYAGPCKGYAPGISQHPGVKTARTPDGKNYQCTQGQEWLFMWYAVL